MEQLFHLIYASAATREISEAEILSLLGSARINNRNCGITGMLLFTGESFFQILEGPENAILDLFELIRKDPRHAHVTRIIQEPIPRRSFAEWSMACAMIRRSELASIDGLNDFFEGASCLSDLDGGRAKKLLHAFAAGRWRKTLS